MEPCGRLAKTLFGAIQVQAAVALHIMEDVFHWKARILTICHPTLIYCQV